MVDVLALLWQKDRVAVGLCLAVITVPLCRFLRSGQNGVCASLVARPQGARLCKSTDMQAYGDGFRSSQPRIQVGFQCSRKENRRKPGIVCFRRRFVADGMEVGYAKGHLQQLGLPPKVQIGVSSRATRTSARSVPHVPLAFKITCLWLFCTPQLWSGQMDTVDVTVRCNARKRVGRRVRANEGALL